MRYNIFSKVMESKLQKIFHKILKQTIYGKISVTYPNNDTYDYGINDDYKCDIKLNNFKFISDVILKGNIGFAESYIYKNFYTSNLSKLIEFIILNQKTFLKVSNGNIFYRFFQKILHSQKNNTKKNSLKNISHHYDLGNEFYQSWLDETMSYSSALFNKKSENLKEGQLNKYNRLIEIIKPTENNKILEIGCGWGKFTEYLAKNTNAHITAVTISKNQYNDVCNLIQSEGLQDKVNIQLKDYRDINYKFNSIVSIEMFEAVGEKYWPLFFEKLRNNLKSEGKAALQIITISNKLFENYRKRPDFIQRYIFPGGMLPSKKILNKLIVDSGLTLKDEFNFANSCAKTLELWNINFQKSWPEISKKGFNEYFKRMWEYYFSYCEGGFRAGTIDISQFLISK